MSTELLSRGVEIWTLFTIPCYFSPTNSLMGLVALMVDSTDTEHFHHDRELRWPALVGSSIPSQFPPIT